MQCLGDRYATDQFLVSAVIDDDLIDLVAGGGVVGRIDAAHDRMKVVTRLKTIGLLTAAVGQVLNVVDYDLPALAANDRATVIGVFGASMHSGNTTAASSLAHGIMWSGDAIAGIKPTGTGAFGEFNAFEDGGVTALGFTDVGMATTFRMPLDRIEAEFDTLVATTAAPSTTLSSTCMSVACVTRSESKECGSRPYEMSATGWRKLRVKLIPYLTRPSPWVMLIGQKQFGL